MIRILLLLILPTALLADVPRKPVLTRYSQLWLDSPFTSKPVAPTTTRDIENPIDDYALGGISKLKDGYYAVLISKKEPDKREVIKPGGDSDFEILDVKWGQETWKETVATVKSGAHQGQVGFDDKLMTPKAAAPQAPQQTQPGRPVIPGLKPNPQQNPPGARQPRPRVVRPPTPPVPNANSRRRR